MFYQDEYVHAQFQGYGRVMRSGRDPLVRLPGGLEKRVPANVLRLVSKSEYEEQLANRMFIEDWAYSRVYHQRRPRYRMDYTIHPERPLANRMVEAARRPGIYATDLQESCSESGVV